MAVNTCFSSSYWLAGPPVTPTGINCFGGDATIAVTGTASSVVLTGAYPNGTTFVDFWIAVHTGGVAQTLKWGTSNSPSGIMAKTSLSQTYSISTQAVSPTPYGIFNQGWLRAPGDGHLMPVKLSLSTTGTVSDLISGVQTYITVGVALSASAQFTHMMFYTNNGMAGRTAIR